MNRCFSQPFECHSEARLIPPAYALRSILEFAIAYFQTARLATLSLKSRG